MSSFENNGITSKGNNLLAKVAAGLTRLNYTKAVVGDGTLGNGQAIISLTNLISPQNTWNINRLVATPGDPAFATVGFVYSNQSITSSYYLREIGIFATDPDEGEILYWYGNAGATADYIKPGDGTGSDIIEKKFDIGIYVGQSANVTATINGSLVYPTLEEFDAAIAAARQYTDQKFASIVIEAASTTKAGVTKLNNATNSTSQTEASTPLATKTVMDKATKAETDAATAQARAVSAEANSRRYADDNFRKPDELITANIIRNSTGMLGKKNWTGLAGNWKTDTNYTVGAFFHLDDAVPAGNQHILRSDTVAVASGAKYQLQAVFHTNAVYTEQVYIDIVNASTNAVIAKLMANPNSWWHRKSIFVTIPTGCSFVYLNLVVGGSSATPSATKGFARIKLSECQIQVNGAVQSTAVDTPYSNEMDIDSLFQYGVNKKADIAGVINAKGVPASASDDWDVLKNKITQIKSTLTKENIDMTQSIDYERYSDYNYNEYIYYFNVAVIPAGSSYFQFNGRSIDGSGTGSGWSRPIPSSSYIYAASTTSYSQSASSAYLVLIDANGYEWSITSVHAPSNTTGWDNTQFNMLEIDYATRKLYSDSFGTRSDTTDYWLTSYFSNVPPTFDLTRAVTMKIKFQVLKPVSGWSYTRLSYKMRGQLKYI